MPSNPGVRASDPSLELYAKVTEPRLRSKEKRRENTVIATNTSAIGLHWGMCRIKHLRSTACCQRLPRTLSREGGDDICVRRCVDDRFFTEPLEHTCRREPKIKSPVVFKGRSCCKIHFSKVCG